VLKIIAIHGTCFTFGSFAYFRALILCVGDLFYLSRLMSKLRDIQDAASVALIYAKYNHRLLLDMYLAGVIISIAM